jgi:NAD(P)-dependent dehydrogenase (short-subunit alcohol dehydrogenase family)
MSELAGQVALVTGGARNIGRAIARALASGGASVAVNARSQSDDLAQTVKLIEDAGGHAMAVVADVTDASSVRRMVDATVERFGRLDILVNNAAVRIEQPFDAITLDDWHRIVSIGSTARSCAARRRRTCDAPAAARSEHRRRGLTHGCDAARARRDREGRRRPRRRARSRARCDHRELRGPGAYRDGPRSGSRAMPRIATLSPGTAGRSRGDGAHAVRSRRALHHGPVDARERRHPPGMSARRNGDAVSG